MKNLQTKKTYNTPEVNLDAESGVLHLKGRSIPEYADEFYNPILEWIDQYVKKPKDETVVKVQLEYFNTISKKYILEFLQKLDKLYKNGSKVSVLWQYEEEIEEDVVEEGEEFEKLVTLPFEYVMVNE